MIFHTYILQSQSTGKYYCGHTNNIVRRLNEHNDPEYRSTKTTKKDPGPWVVVWTQEFGARSDAMLRERWIKKRGIKRFLADELNR